MHKFTRLFFSEASFIAVWGVSWFIVSLPHANIIYSLLSNGMLNKTFSIFNDFMLGYFQICIFDGFFVNICNVGFVMYG